MSPEDQIELMIMDDGVGIPEEMDFNNPTSLGLELVKILAEDQLRKLGDRPPKQWNHQESKI